MLRNWCALTVVGWSLASAQAIVRVSDPLTQLVPAYTARNVPKLDALIGFGRENGIPLGIELSAKELDELMSISTKPGEMALERDMDPAAKGFAGSRPSGDPTDQVGD